MNRKAKILTRSTIYESPWVNLHVDRVEFPGGRIAEEHHCVDFPKHGVAALVLNGAGEILMIRSHRYIIDSVEWEIPAGGFEPSAETPAGAARREVLEETGYDSSEYEHFYTYYPMIGISNATFYLVRAKALEKKGEFDPNEVEAVAWVSPDRARSMIAKGEIRDGFTLSALLFHLAGIPGHEK